MWQWIVCNLNCVTPTDDLTTVGYSFTFSAVGVSVTE